jgi:hypothetical protein
VVLQQFDDVQLIVSNNGGGAGLRDVVAEASGGVRLTYVEQPTELCMPDHWELISQQARGRYLIFLADRSVLKRNALRALAQLLSTPSAPRVVSWPWDIYFEHLQLLEPYRRAGQDGRRSSRGALFDFASGMPGLDRVLPRGLNSCVSNDLVVALRKKFGAAFGRLNPDYSFAFGCLASTEEFHFLDSSQMISQGVSVSNGLTGYFGDPSPYLEAIGVDQPFVYVPHRIPLVQNTIHEDFLRVASVVGDSELLKAWSRENYYAECAEELIAKEAYGILDRHRVADLKASFELALHNEPEAVRRGYAERLRDAGGLVGRLRRTVRRRIGGRWEAFRPLWLRLRGGRHVKSALSAAGFDVEQ